MRAILMHDDPVNDIQLFGVTSIDIIDGSMLVAFLNAETMYTAIAATGWEEWGNHGGWGVGRPTILEAPMENGKIVAAGISFDDLQLRLIMSEDTPNEGEAEDDPVSDALIVLGITPITREETERETALERAQQNDAMAHASVRPSGLTSDACEQAMARAVEEAEAAGAVRPVITFGSPPMTAPASARHAATYGSDGTRVAKTPARVGRARMGRRRLGM